MKSVTRYFKGCIAPKEISHIRQAGKAKDCLLRFRGIYGLPFLSDIETGKLSAITRLRQTGLHSFNSVANVPKALYPLGSYERIHCFFDNDHAGMEALRQIRMEYGS